MTAKYYIGAKISIFILLSILLNFAASTGPNQVILTLDAKWPHASLIMEAAEFMSGEGNGLFWQYIEYVMASASSAQLAQMSDQEKYNLAIKQASKSLGAARIDLLKFAMSLRLHSTNVEMYRQMALTLDQSSKCSTFVLAENLAADVTICDAKSLRESLKNLKNSNQRNEKLSIYKSDHHYPGSKDSENTIILYGDLVDDNFREMHRFLCELARERKINYIFRPFVTPASNDTVRLSGYGVELAIKSTEYKAQDDSKIDAKSTGTDGSEGDEETDLHGFNFATLKKVHPDLKDSLNEFKLHLYDTEELAPLKVWQLQELSVQAAQKVLGHGINSIDGLKMLADISQNFPAWARSLTRTTVKPELKHEIVQNQEYLEENLGLSAGSSALFINGIHVDVESSDIFQIFDILKREEKLSAGFFQMGFRREYLSLLMNLNLEDDSDNYAVDYRDAFPLFINDLDKGKEYREWGNSVKMMLQPYFPGMIRPVARNFFTLVFILEPATKQGRSLLQIAKSFYAHKIPVRIGIVFAVSGDKKVSGLDDANVALLNLFNFVNGDTQNPVKSLKILTDIFAENPDRDNVPVDAVLEKFKKLHTDLRDDVDDIFGPDSDYDDGRKAGIEFLQRSGLGKAPKVLLNGIPLDDSGLSADRFEETVINMIMKITPKIQRAIMQGELTERTNVAEWVMSQGNVMPRLNKFILDSDKESTSERQRSKFLDLTDVMEHNVKSASDIGKMAERHRNQYMMQTAKYVRRTDESKTLGITVWIVTDLNTERGRQLAYSAIKHLKHSHETRVSIMHNGPISPKTSDVTKMDIAKMVQAAMHILPVQHRKQFVTKLVKEEIAQKLLANELSLEEIAVHEMGVAGFKKEVLNLDFDKIMSIHNYFAKETLELTQEQSAVIVNGQVFGPLDPENQDHVFDEFDFALIEKFAMNKAAKVIKESIDMWDVPAVNDRSSDVVARVYSLVLANPVRKRRVWPSLADDKHSVLTLSASDDSTAALDIFALLDPLSRDAQKLAPILVNLESVVNADVKVVMNCRTKLSEMPLKSFYRYVLEPELQFSPDGKLRPMASSARFGASLPQKQLLTLNVHSPEAWLVEAIQADYDLDNLIIEKASGDILARFQLSHILLEGHCFDEITGQPPRGLQFTLGPKSDSKMQNTVDTIVMQNLGYFQLKATPGEWELRLRRGRSTEIYDIVGHSNTDSSAGEQTVTVILDSLPGKIIRVTVAKKPDKVDENLLVDENEPSEVDDSIWGSISSTLGTAPVTHYDKINIFSLASGHLYERFMRIMMLTVMKHTKHPVKFWLLKNYLSPKFKESLPTLAVYYKFEYELVEYKWPRWLHQQTEKQRMMWGYKILFLDVLFPLDVKKIIFVDADQIVRTDLMELMQMDLEGAPYGYTPFCDSRKEMDGYRFWKSGYWSNHLAGRKYHISALYVVDLRKFRQIAAGDRLRGQYQGLSADPNSLSNLDQDLPNNMIHQVKIKSLPQEWLWCETWCDDASKKSAKTIDMCNNPQTKEPKLELAMRVVPEWREYDSEIKSVLASKTDSEPDIIRSESSEKIELGEERRDEHTDL